MTALAPSVTSEAFHGERLRGGNHAVKIEFADGGAVELDGDAVLLRVGDALERDVESERLRGGGVEMGDEDILLDRIAGDHGAEEIIVVLAVQQRSEIADAIFADDGEGEAGRRGAAGVGSRGGLDALGETIFANEPIDARAGEGRVDAGAVEFDGAGGCSGDEHGLLDAFSEQAQRARIGVGIEARRIELGERNGIPTFLIYADFDGGVIRHGRNRSVRWRHRPDWTRREDTDIGLR